MVKWRRLFYCSRIKENKKTNCSQIQGVAILYWLSTKTTSYARPFTYCEFEEVVKDDHLIQEMDEEIHKIEKNNTLE